MNKFRVARTPPAKLMTDTERQAGSTNDSLLNGSFWFARLECYGERVCNAVTYECFPTSRGDLHVENDVSGCKG